MKNKSKKEEAKKLSYKGRLTYLAIAIAVIIIIAGLLFRIYSSYPSQPKAAIVDQLSSSRLTPGLTQHKNMTFINRARELLYTRFSKVDYYSDNATVNLYERLALENYKLIIWRAHSALDLESSYIAISTSEKYGSRDYGGYVESGQLTGCNVSGDLFYGITPKFIAERMGGRFEDTVIVLMSCNGLLEGYTSTADAFIEKGVKVLISWDGWIAPSTNDHEVALLLDYLLNQNNTIHEAVSKTIHYTDPFYGPSKLDYYPRGNSEVEDYQIPDYRQNNIQSSMGAIALVAFKRKV